VLSGRRPARPRHRPLMGCADDVRRDRYAGDWRSRRPPSARAPSPSTKAPCGTASCPPSPTSSSPRSPTPTSST